MATKFGGVIKMKMQRFLPEKLFGVDTNLIMVWLGPGAILVAFGLIFGGVLWPKVGEISRTVSAVKKTWADTKTVNDKRNYFQSVNQGELQANALLLSSGILPEKNAYLLVKIIQTVAAGQGYAVSDFSVSLGDIKNQEAKKSKTAYDKVPVKLVLTGPAEAYLRLVGALEKNLPILSIDSFEMRSAAEVATIDMVVSAFYLPEGSTGKIENLSLAQLTLKKDEAALLSRIAEFKPYQVGGLGEENNKTFQRYDRSDPFFTP